MVDHIGIQCRGVNVVPSNPIKAQLFGLEIEGTKYPVTERQMHNLIVCAIRQLARQRENEGGKFPPQDGQLLTFLLRLQSRHKIYG